MSRLVTMNFQRLIRCFLAGILAVLPVVITVAIVAWAAGFVRKILGPGTLIGDGLTGLGLRFVTNDTVAYLIGGLLVLGCVLVIGIVVEAGAKNLLQRLLDVAMRRIPIVNSIYGTSKQLVTLFEKKDPAKLQGMKAVFCFFGEKTGAGILALLVSPEQYCINGRNYSIVIVPTAPVPVGGGLFFIPVEMIQPTEVSVEGLMSIYVSMGVSAPQFLPGVTPASP
ncbi:MAG: DUF502 domain-containing protein [Thermoguttaceae bacterium]